MQIGDAGASVPTPPPPVRPPASAFQPTPPLGASQARALCSRHCGVWSGGRQEQARGARAERRAKEEEAEAQAEA
eukprot:106172-Alexandrium_andersonii.AAC.1